MGWEAGEGFMTAEVRALPLMDKIVQLVIVCVMLATPMAAAQEIQDDPNRPADQLVPVDSSMTPAADELETVDNRRTCDTTQSDGPVEPDVSMTKFGTVDLAVQDADLSKILEMLSVQSRKNIIAGRDVVATVSANLYDVTFHEALDSILRVNGYGYIEEGNFIYVHPIDEIERIQSAAKRVP